MFDSAASPDASIAYIEANTPFRKAMNRLPGLLVGIFCLLAVAMILFPVFARGREISNRGSCLTNIKNLGLSIAMYSEDYDQRFPIASRWADQTFPYLKSEQVYYSPELHSYNDTKATRPIYRYAFNSTLSGQSTQRMWESETLLLCDTYIQYRNANAPGHTALANPPRHPERVEGNIKYSGFNCELTLDGHRRLSYATGIEKILDPPLNWNGTIKTKAKPNTPAEKLK